MRISFISSPHLLLISFKWSANQRQATPEYASCHAIRNANAQKALFQLAVRASKKVMDNPSILGFSLLKVIQGLILCRRFQRILFLLAMFFSSGSKCV